ncbi:MAG TPA: hypothetical protein PK772_08395, partial [Chitinophagaceae bacterium]|nr:hypothetical protein [Chitinophagaceae bacterium]
MKTSILLMLLIFTAVYVQSCCSGKKYIYITNNSTEKIYVAKTFTSPDTSISFPKSWLNVVLPSTSRDFPIGLCKEKDE